MYINKKACRRFVTFADIEHLADRISIDLQAKLDSILEKTETMIMSLADKYETGNIQLTNLSMKDKLITLFLRLKSLTGKPNRRSKKMDTPFTDMDLNDIAQILCLHFAPYKGRKIDDIETQKASPDISPRKLLRLISASYINRNTNESDYADNSTKKNKNPHLLL